MSAPSPRPDSTDHSGEPLMLPCLSECILSGTALGVSGHFTNQKTEVWGWTRPRQGSPAPLGPKAVCLQVPTLHVQLFLSLRYRKTPKSQAHPRSAPPSPAKHPRHTWPWGVRHSQPGDCSGPSSPLQCPQARLPAPTQAQGLPPGSFLGCSPLGVHTPAATPKSPLDKGCMAASPHPL